MLILSFAVAFGLELVALFAFGLWGVHLGQHPLTRPFLSVGTPLLVAVFWGVFLSPKAAVQPSPLLRLGLKLAVFALAAAALVAAGHFVSGTVFGVLAASVTLGLHTSGVSLEQFHSLQRP